MKIISLSIFILISVGTIFIAIMLKYAPQDRTPTPSDLATAIYFSMALAFFGISALIIFCYKSIVEKIKNLERK